MSELTLIKDQKFQQLTSVEMKNRIKYVAGEYYGKWFWIDDTFSINCWDGQKETVVAKFVGKREMIMLNRLILSGERRYVTIH